MQSSETSARCDALHAVFVTNFQQDLPVQFSVDIWDGNQRAQQALTVLGPEAEEVYSFSPSIALLLPTCAATGGHRDMDGHVVLLYEKWRYDRAGAVRLCCRVANPRTLTLAPPLSGAVGTP